MIFSSWSLFSFFLLSFFLSSFDSNLTSWHSSARWWISSGWGGFLLVRLIEHHPYPILIDCATLTFMLCFVTILLRAKVYHPCSIMIYATMCTLWIRSCHDCGLVMVCTIAPPIQLLLNQIWSHPWTLWMCKINYTQYLWFLNVEWNPLILVRFVSWHIHHFLSICTPCTTEQTD